MEKDLGTTVASSKKIAELYRHLASDRCQKFTINPQGTQTGHNYKAKRKLLGSDKRLKDPL